MKTMLATLVCCFSFLLVPTEAAEFRAGAAAVDVTPTRFPVLVNGGLLPRRATKVVTRLHARAIVLDDGNQRLGIVVVDSCMMPRPLLDEAKQLAARRTKIKADRMLISATHTHTAPASMGCLGTDADPSYVPYLRARLVEALVAAEANLEPARVGWAVASAAEFTALRRWIHRPDRVTRDPFGDLTVRANMHSGRNHDNVTGESGPEDPDLSLISFQATDGRPIAVLANFSMHYFSGQQPISADYFGLFSEGMAARMPKGDDSPPFVGIMSHGCSGDIWRSDYTKPADSQVNHNKIEDYTEALLDIAMKAYESIEYRSDVDLAMAEARLNLRYRVPGQQRLEWARKMVEELGDRPATTRPEVYALEAIILHQRQATEVVVQALRVGDIGIATTPTETYALTGLKLKLRSPLAKTMVIELANGGDGYIPPPEQHLLGGYNTWPARSAGLEVQAEPKIVEAALQLFETVADRPRRSFQQSRGPAFETLLDAKPAIVKRDALELIEAFRGGRHWVDDETAAPRSPEDSLKTLVTEPGLEVELFAAEPLVMDPVALAFDRRGRMFVVEYGDYPIGPPKGEPPLSKVVLVEDTDGDGQADRRRVFADRLNFAHSLMPLNEGLLVCAQTRILFLKDTDGDDVADVREVLFDGFKPAHPQRQIGNPRWGLDNWIYLNYGPGRITSALAPDKPVDMPAAEFRFHPLTREFGPASGLGQYGNTIDDWGHRFFCTNRNPIITTIMPRSAVTRNPFAVLANVQYDVGPSGGDTRVYPLVEMKSNYLSHAGTHTSACGVTAYRGDLFDDTFSHSLFACEPVGNLVTRSIVKPLGVALTAERARPKADFLASSDTWFRPSSLATGPDGALYVADMYRLWVEHPKFLPPEIAARLDWRAGDDRGRIYRVVPRNTKGNPYTPPKTTDQIVRLLTDSNGWRRHLAQRLLVERRSKRAAPAVRELLAASDAPLTRLHALWTLDGLAELTPDDLTGALDDRNVFVRRDAVKLLGRRLKKHPELFDKLAKLAGDDDVRVRFQVALALGETDDPRGAELLTAIALRDGDDRWSKAAILTSAAKRSGAIVAGLLKNDGFAGRGEAARIALIRDLATVVGSRGDENELASLMAALTATDRTGAWWQTAVLSGLATGLPRHRGSLGRTSLPKLVARPPERLEKSVDRVRVLLQRTLEVALERDGTIADRLAAIELLGYQPFDQASSAFESLLATDQPVDVQLACVSAMRRNGNEGAATIVLDRWPTLGPTVRGPALALVWRRAATIRKALELMAEGKIEPSVVGIDQRVRLLKNSNPRIRELSAGLFGGAVSADRREVAARYRPALTGAASSSAGSKVFQRVCAKCHKINGKGFEAGPDISDVRNRSREALLYDILDPNAKVEPRFMDYSVVLVDGRVFNGLMVSETVDAVVLKQAENQQQVIARNDIEIIQASGKSLMPEGVEKDITIQQMTDLLEYLQARD